MIGQQLHRDDGQHGLQGVHGVGHLDRLKKVPKVSLGPRRRGGGRAGPALVAHLRALEGRRAVCS